MKKLDDLVFKNLHGLKDEEDEIKHKNEKKASGTQPNSSNFSSNMPNDYEKMLEMQQQQQQMMYNYYNNPYANRMQQQQLNVQGFQQQGFNAANMQNMSMQNKQNLQGNSQYNVNMMGNQNTYTNPQQMNMSNYSQNGNFANQQGQMQGIQGMGQMSSMPQLPNNVSFSQLPPLVQKQFLQMYQMAQMKQANQGFTGQVGGNNLQGNQNYSMYQTQQANMGGNSPYFNTNEGASPGISSQMSSMNTLGFPTSPGFPAGNQISSKGQIEDDFADFQTANNSSKQAEKDPFAEFSSGFGQQSHQGNFNKNAEDDFDDFQDAVQAKVADDDEFDDFKDANNTGNQNKEPEGEKNWDILDDFVEKKELTQPQIPQTTQTQQQAMHMQQNVPVNQQIYQQNAGNMQMQGMNYQGMHLGHQQGIGYPGNVNVFGQGFGPTSGNSGTENKEDDFADFEEAKPTQIQPKTSAKEDILFGALEKKLKKGMLHEPENEQEKDDDFGGFEETKPQGNIWEMNFGGETQQAVDDFEDFEQAGVENQQTTTQQNNPPPQDGKKLTIYDIDLTEFGITDTAQELKTTEAPKTNIEQNVQNDDKEGFGDFVEIKEEKNDSGQQPKDTQNFYETSHDFDFGTGAGLGESEKKAPIQDWNFESGIGQNKYDQVEIETEQHSDNNDDNKDDDGFDDFEQAQEAKPENIEVNKKEENDDFAEFQFEPTAQNKEGENQWEKGGFGGEIKWNESKQEKDEGFDFGDFQEENPKKETIEDVGGLDGFDFGNVNVNVNANTGQDNKNTFFEMGFDQKGTETEQKGTNENKDDMWDNFDQGFEGFNKIEEKVKETKVDEENEGREKKEDNEGFDDFEEYTEPKKAENENNFDDFQWNDAPVQQEKVEEDNEQNKQEEFDDEGFGDFEGGKTEEKEIKIENNEDVKEVNNPTFEKKVTIYDIDFTEFGIEEKDQQGLPPLELNFGFNENKDNIAKTDQQPQKGLGDLYSLYGNTAVTPELKDTTKEEEDLFGDMQGPTQQEVNNHLEEIGTPNAHIDHNNIEEPNDNQEEGFDDFEEAGYEEPKQTQSNYPEAATPTEDFHAKNTNLFTDPFENPTTPANYAEEESREEGFGDFEDASPALDIRVEPTQDIILQEETIPVNNEDEDGFDDFEDAGHEVKQGKDGTPVKSLSNLGASMLPQETSDFGSLAEVQVGHNEEHKEKDIGSIKEEEMKGDGNDDFGSFNEVEVEKGKRENVFDQKDESIFNAVESSDDSHIKEKEKNPFTEDEFGDFVRSKQDVTQEKIESSSVNEKEEEKYDVESVLAEFGVSTNDSEEVEEKGEDLTEEIEKRAEEITEEYEKNLFESSLMRNSLAKSKFKVNSEMIEDLVKELKSLQKYKEALMTQGQIKVAEEIKTLNEEKTRLIEEEELEEAIKYRDIIKNKEKELLSKEKFEELLNYYHNMEKKDYRLVLLDELRAAGVPNKHVNHFYIRFLGRTAAIIKKTEEDNLMTDNPETEIPVEEQLEEKVEIENVQETLVQENDENVETFEDPKEEPQAEPEVENQENEEEKNENLFEENKDKNDEAQNKEEEGGDDFEDFNKAEINNEPQVENAEQNDEKKDEDNEDQRKEQGDGFEEFNQADTTQFQTEKAAEPEENLQNIDENKDNENEEKEDDGFEGFNQAENVERNTEKNVEENKEQANEEDDGFQDFNQAEGTAQPEGEQVIQPEETIEKVYENQNEGKESEEDDGFEDFNQAEITNQPQVEAAEQSNKKNEEDNKEDKEDDDGFEDFNQAETINPPQIENIEQKDEKNDQIGEEDDGFGGFDQAGENKNEAEEDDGFEGFNQAEIANKPQAESQNVEKQGVNKEEEEDEFDDFQDYDQAENTTQLQPEVKIETNSPSKDQDESQDEPEIIIVEKIPETLEEMQELKEKTTKWALMVKVVYSSGEEFNINMKKVLKQIVFELYRFHKITDDLLKDNNQDVIKAVLNSEKFEKYVHGIKILSDFYEELKSSFEFLCIRKNYIKRYGKAIEQLIQRINALKDDIKEKYNKEYIPENKQEAVKGHEWLASSEKLEKKALSHEYFEFQMKHNNEKRKTMEDFYKIIEERAYIEDQYSKGMDRIINSFEQLNLEGSLHETLKRIITGQRERVSLGRSHTLLVRKGVLEPMKDMMKKQSSEVKSWASEEKKLEKEYKNYIEKIEKLKNEYMSKAKECDVVGLEAESLLLNKKTNEEDRTKITQKYTESQNTKMDKETAYQGKILEFNSFLEQFQRELEKTNNSLLNHELEMNGSIQQALFKFLDYEKVQALSYEQNVIPLCKVLEKIDSREETAILPKGFTGTKDFPSQVQPVEYNSFFEQGLLELKESDNTKDEGVIKAFRNYFEGIIKEEKKETHSRFYYEDLQKQELESLNFIAGLMSAAWKGRNVNNDSMQKLQKLLTMKLYRNVVVATLQQYRLGGKFLLCLDGFRNIKTILFYLLDECLKSKDIANTTKIMILSLTFWKISRAQDGTEEKKYLQDGIQWHAIWKDLDFWSTANYLSLHEEIMKKGFSSKEGIESEKECQERQNMIVYSQLLSYAYNMSSFGVDRAEIKKITQQFYQYYSLDECRVKELMNAIENINKEMESSNNRSSPRDIKEGRGSHRRGNSLIKGFFVKKSLDSPEMSVREIRSKDIEEKIG